MRALALVLALGAGIVSACDSSTDATASALDPGPTFGVEVTVNVSGNGRVVSTPGSIDCPSSCFTRITSADHDFDGADLGMTLTATAGAGSHFVGWSTLPLVSGTRARGPAECSPMTRNALGPPIGPLDNTVVLPYGETQGTPPKGLEAECAPYTTVPVAFALVATFAEDPAQPFFGQDAATPGEVVFEPPTDGTDVAREIGVHGNLLYVRYDHQNQNGTTSLIMSGPKDGSAALMVQFESIESTVYRLVSIGPNLVAQDEDFVLSTLNLTTLARGTQSLGVGCSSLATDDRSAYCRFTSGGQSYLYTWPLDGSGFVQYVYTLPNGSDLAVDDASVYFTQVPTNLGVFGGATIESAPKAPDASGLPDAAVLVPGLNAPSHLTATSTDLIWLDIDDQSLLSEVSHAPKTGAEAGLSNDLSAPISTIAVDPVDARIFYVATVASATNGGGEIHRYRTDGGKVTDIALYGIPSLNGLAVDETYVYWTENDGRVYRAPK